MTRQEHRREARSRRQPPVRLEFSLAEALALQTVALRDDDIVYNSTLHVHGVCRPSELLAVAEELGEGVRFRVALLPTARPHLGQVIALYPVGRKPLRHNGVDVPFVSIFRRAQFDGIYARLVATNQKPQRLFPVNHDGDLGFVGEAGAGYTADTLDETLSLGRDPGPGRGALNTNRSQTQHRQSRRDGVPIDRRNVVRLLDGDGLPAGPSPTQVLVDAVAMAAGLLDWSKDIVCYTPAIGYPGVFPVHELMQASLAVSDSHRASTYATAAHYMVGQGVDRGVYIFLAPGVCGPAMQAHEMEAVQSLIAGRNLPIAVLYRRADFDPLHHAMADKPQRVWPAEEDGGLWYFGRAGGERLVGATLAETLAATMDGTPAASAERTEWTA